MDNESLYHFCKCQYQLYEIPIRIYQGGKLIATFDRDSIGKFEADRDTAVLETLSGLRDNPIYFNIQNALLLEGAVFDRSSDTIIYMGLVRAVRITESIARRYFEDRHVTGLSEKTISEFHRYLNNLPVVAPGIFAVILSAVNTFLNGDVIEPRTIFESNVEGAGDPAISAQMLRQREERYFGGGNTQNAYELEEQFLFFVKNGMVRELREICEQPGFGLYGDASNPDAWRMTKDRCIVGVAVVSRAAISAGVPVIEAFQLCDFYIQKAELCKSAKTLNEIRVNMLLDFAERVSELKLRNVENRMVRSVAEYIMEHLEEKVSLSELAEQLNVNKTYLCGVFKKEMGMGIIEFTNYHKINIAKQMLRFTDKSLIEISTYLNYCSQSYFQQVFKKVTGMTPTDYRNSKEN